MSTAFGIECIRRRNTRLYNSLEIDAQGWISFQFCCIMLPSYERAKIACHKYESNLLAPFISLAMSDLQ